MGLLRAANDLQWTGERYVPNSRGDARILLDDSVAHAFVTHRRKNLQSELARRMHRDLRLNDGR